MSANASSAELQELEDDEVFSSLQQMFPTIPRSALARTYLQSNRDAEKCIDTALTLSVVQTELKEQKQGSVDSSTLKQTVVSTVSSSGTRGVRALLPKTFLSVPRSRLVSREICDGWIHYVSIYLRLHGKLLLAIQCVNSIDVVVKNIVPVNNQQQYMPSASEIAIGDVIQGINDEFFDPFPLTQDIAELIYQSQNCVKLHYKRPIHGHVRASTSRNNSPQPKEERQHNFVVQLMKRNMLSQQDCAVVDAQVKSLYRRARCWDTLLLLGKIISQRLYDHLDDLSMFRCLSNLNKTNGYSTYAAASKPDESLRNVQTTHAAIVETFQMTEEELETSSIANNYRNDVDSLLAYLRPALSAALLSCSERETTFAYIIWVRDITTGTEWVLERTFEEFVEFNLRIRLMRKSFSELNPQLTSSSSSNQISILQKFIRSILHTITVNSHHPSTIRIFLLLLAFLDVRQQLKLLKHSTDGKAIPTSDGVTDASSSVWCQSSAISWGADKGESLLRLFVHSILQLPALGQLIGNYVNSFLVNYSIDVISKGKINGKNVAESVNSYIEQLVVLLLDCFYENCKEILIVNESRSCLDRNNRISITANFVDINKTAIDADPFDDSKGKIHNSSVVEDNLLFAVRSIIREQLEIELFVPISNNINYLLKLSTGTEEQLIRSHVHNLKRQPQSYYGIPLHQISLTGWASVIEKLQTIRIHLLPISRIEALLSLAKTITKLYKEEHADCTEPFGADDMFPVFLYIIVNSDLTYVLALSLELQIFCDSEKKLGEMGYYLATLEAALDHLLRTDKIGVDEVID